MKKMTVYTVLFLAVAALLLGTTACKQNTAPVEQESSQTLSEISTASAQESDKISETSVESSAPKSDVVSAESSAQSSAVSKASAESSVQQSSTVSEVSTERHTVSTEPKESSEHSSSSQDSSQVSQLISASSEYSYLVGPTKKPEPSAPVEKSKNLKELMKKDGKIKTDLEQWIDSYLGNTGTSKVSVKGTNTVRLDYTYNDVTTDTQKQQVKLFLNTQSEIFRISLMNGYELLREQIEEQGAKFELCFYATDGEILFDKTYSTESTKQNKNQ